MTKHEHGTPNPIILAEERSILSIVDRALASTSNAQIIGRNGEIPIRDFLNRYVPFTLRAATGHFLTPSGAISPQLDVMILDARYPLLASNLDGSVLAMLHGVIAVYEVKTTLRTSDLKKLWSDAVRVARLAAEVPEFSTDGFGTVKSDAIAYRLGASLSALEAAYIKRAEPFDAGLDVYILRLPDAEQPLHGEVGAILHCEPMFDDDVNGPVEYLPICSLSHTPLSDMYYRLVQDSYYALAARDWGFGEIGEHVMHYMSWATLSWDAYSSRRNER